MNKREFVASGVSALVAAPVLASPNGQAGSPLRGLLGRTQRRPDLVEAPGAAAFEAYLGERFTVTDGPDAGLELVLAAVDRVVRCAATDQFTLRLHAAATVSDVDGLRTLAHATGQRLTLHLERSAWGFDARFNLLA